MHTWLLLGGGLLTLYLGAEALVRGSASLALRWGITPLVVGITILSFGTSAPELVVSMQAAYAGESSLALGNVIGSNIANVLLVLGLAAVIKPIKVRRHLIRREIPLLIGATLLLALMLLNQSLERWEGGVLVVGFIFFIGYAVHAARRHAPRARREEEPPCPRLNRSLAWLGLVGGLVALWVGSRWLVAGALAVAQQWEWSPYVVGLTLIALGTSLPEIATSIVASLRDEGELALGNAVGSNIFNILAVLGGTAILFGMDSQHVSMVDIGLLVASAAIALPIMWTGFVVSRLEGVALLAGYAGYLAWITWGYAPI